MRNLSITMHSVEAHESLESVTDEQKPQLSQGVTGVTDCDGCDSMLQLNSQSVTVDVTVNLKLLEQFKNSLLTFRNLIASHYGDTELSGSEKLTLPQRIAKGVAWVRAHPSDLNAIKALNGLRARETKMFERESDEANRMSEIERELCGDGRVICSECFEIYSVDRDCACGWWPWADGKRQEQEVRIAECQ